MLARIVAEAPDFFSYYNVIFLLQAMLATFALSAIGCVFGFAAGFFLAVSRRTTSLLLLPLRTLTTTFIEMFRRIPFLVTLMMVFFVFQVLGFDISMFSVALISVCLIATAFIAEIIRAGLESVHRTQWDTAAAMNMSLFQTLRYVIMPQAWKIILPPVFSFFILFIKDTALASQIGVVELTYAGKVLNNKGFSAALVFGSILILYFIISYPLARFGARLEQKLAAAEILDLKAAYGQVPVLENITLSVKKGEIVSLIGPSGSGKSTLLRVLIGLLPPIAGQVSLDGGPIDYGNKRTLRSLRDRLAIVFQQYNLFQNMTALQNVTIAPTKVKKRPAREVEEEAKVLLSKVGLGDKFNAYPDELSGGQQQRVAIARALALRPEILLLDEVTSALDPELVNEVLDAIRLLAAEGMTMFIVSHEMGFVRELSSKVAFMADGHIVEIGPPARIFDQPEMERTRDFVSKILRH